MSGELAKLKITAYSDEKFKSKVGDGEFKVHLNPDSYSLKYKIEQTKEQAQGTSSSEIKFNKIPPKDLDLEFVFDRSGVVPDYSSSGSDNTKTFKDEGSGIIDDIEKFKKIVFDYNGDQHKPNYLIIFWGALLFKGCLVEMDITFKLFKPDGTPLRASIKAKFKGFVEDNLRVAMENRSSPDLTHVRTVLEGDTLPLMAFRIYGDPKYYLQVAKANKIINFRRLKAGQQIYFPPIQKTGNN
ncbi:MAG: LysM peptidoglycan-binding domain-containing protein [Mariniphaga sp.]|nr:LysM peptidoglycan-binding domain-containing protein [Mariniphaga sp.]